MMRSLCVILLALVSTQLAVTPAEQKQIVGKEQFQYPEVRRNESAVDDYYGTKVADPYRHLEDIDSEEVKQFVEAQNNLTKEYLGRSGMKDKIEETITQVYNYPKYGVPQKHGSRYYTEMNTGLQNQNVWYVQDILDSEPHVFFDPNELSPNGTIALDEIAFSKDGKMVAIGLQSKGSDQVTIRIRNAISGEEFPDVLENIKFSNIAWSKDGQGIFYARYPDDEIKIEQDINQKIYYHRIGTRQDEDVLLVEYPENPGYDIGWFSLSDDGNYLVVFPSAGTGESLVYAAYLEEQIKSGGIRERLELIPIVTQANSAYSYIGTNGSVLYLATNDQAPNWHVVSVDIAHSNIEFSVVVPEHETNILQGAVVVDNDKFVTISMVNVSTQLEVRSMQNGSLLQKLEIPLGTVEGLYGKKSESELFFRVVSFLNPGIIYRVDLPKFPYEVEVLKEVQVPGFDPTDFIEKQVWYESKDGTMVPMYVVHKNDLPMNGNASTFLHGYGGFGISMQPWFTPERIVFIQNFEGVFALPNIRGGGEFGRKWHDDGRVLNKQNVFDDFQAAAEYLIREGYTKPSKLAINGVSNGGLLVGACTNQRPELYGAVVNEVGLHDLLRYQHFTIGHSWCTEYGCSDDGNRIHFENLHRLSPLHNVRLPLNETVQYPPVLILTGDHDDRVVPLHSYKLAAELQFTIGQSSRQTNPLLIKIQADAGHGGGKPTSEIIAEFAEIYAFLVEAAGFNFTE